MLEPSALLTFVLAAYVLIAIPGPAVLYIIARSLEQGRLAGIMSVLGVAVGAGIHTLAATLGLSALLATSAVAFAIVKYLGAAYLIYLGVSTLLKKPANHKAVMVEPKPLWQIFRQGVIVNTLNPKAALFFLAFLPQFADPARGPLAPQIFVLGLIFIVIALLSDALYALLAGQLGAWLKRSRHFETRQKYFSGMIYIALGVAAAISGGRSQA